MQDAFEGEERWLTIGLVKGVVILAVVHTSEDEEHEEVIRIISARKATRKEAEVYANQHKRS